MTGSPDRWLSGDPKQGGWYAPAPDGAPVDEGPNTVEGSVIYFDPDEEDSWVLWDASQSLDPETLERLGLSTALQADLREWHTRWSHTHSVAHRLDPKTFEARGQTLYAEAADLVARVANEIEDGYTVTLRMEAWPKLRH